MVGPHKNQSHSMLMDCLSRKRRPLLKDLHRETHIKYHNPTVRPTLPVGRTQNYTGVNGGVIEAYLDSRFFTSFTRTLIDGRLCECWRCIGKDRHCNRRGGFNDERPKLQQRCTTIHQQRYLPISRQFSSRVYQPPYILYMHTVGHPSGQAYLSITISSTE